MPVTVDGHNALYDLLVFPMLHDKGVGGFSTSSLPIAARSPLATCFMDAYDAYDAYMCAALLKEAEP